jgi:hypothetical protein
MLGATFDARYHNALQDAWIGRRRCGLILSLYGASPIHSKGGMIGQVIRAAPYAGTQDVRRLSLRPLGQGGPGIFNDSQLSAFVALQLTHNLRIEEALFFP